MFNVVSSMHTNAGPPPLMITPMLEEGKAEEAMKKAEVPTNSTFCFVKSYSGFFSIWGTLDADLFFWYFPAMDLPNAPVIVRLQGGPGQSAMFDIFNGFGPFRLDDELRIQRNPETLAKRANLLYFDNPIGTGFSSTSCSEDMARSTETVAEHLFSALCQFLMLFPNQKDNIFYLFGEGYGAKYALSLAKKIHELENSTTIKLKGIILGSPYLDPEVIYKTNKYLFEFGVLSGPESALIDERMNCARKMANKKCFCKAMDFVEGIFGSPCRIPFNKKYYIPEISGISSQYNVLEMEDPQSYNNFVFFVNKPEVRRAIHVGSMTFQDGRMVYDALRNDILRSSEEDLSKVIGKYRILVYNGNLDKKTPAPFTCELFMKYVSQVNKEEFKNKQKASWISNHPLPNREREVGMVIYKNKFFTHVVVCRSGHFVASDKPKIACDVVFNFIWGQDYNQKGAGNSA